MIELSKKVDELVLENSKLKQRICELEENATKKPEDESFENFQSNEQLKHFQPWPSTTPDDVTQREVVTSAQHETSYILPPPIDSFSDMPRTSKSGLSFYNKPHSVEALADQAKTKLSSVNRVLSRLQDKNHREESPRSDDLSKEVLLALTADSTLYENLTQSLALAFARDHRSLTPDNASLLLNTVNETLNVIDGSSGISTSIYGCDEDTQWSSRSSSSLPPPIPSKPDRYKSNQTFESPLYRAIGKPTPQQPPQDRYIDSESAFLSFFDHPLDETLHRLSGERGYSALKQMTSSDHYDNNVHRLMEAVRRENSSQLLKQKNVVFYQPRSDDVMSFSTRQSDTPPSVTFQPPPPPSLASSRVPVRSQRSRVSSV